MALTISVNYIDRVDFGDVASEGWHFDMVNDDWSYIGSQDCIGYPGTECLKVGDYGGYDGGKADFRGLMGPPTGCDTGHEHATFRMDVGMDTGTKTLVLRHLDGSQTDNFDVFVKESDGTYTNIGSYSPITSTEDWVTSEFNFTGNTSITEFKLVATEMATSWCNDGWGQVMFNWAEVR